MIALFLVLACVPVDDRSNGCAGVSEFAYDVGLTAGEDCNGSAPQFMCLAGVGTADPDAWERGCVDCALSQYDLGLADGWSCNID